MGPVTIAVDSYGPVTDNAQSVYELSTIEQIPGIQEDIKKNFGFDAQIREGEGIPRRKRRRRKYVQSDGKTRADRYGRGRRDDDDFFDHRGADEWAAARTDHEALDSSSAFPARPDCGRRRHLLVYRRFDTGGEHRRVSRGGVHQGEHQAGRHDQGVGRAIRNKSSRSVRSTRRRECSTSS